MTNKKQIEKSLKSVILDDAREFVAMLSGEWGIGKTYFWKEFSDKYLKDKDVVYISLFGKNSLADIETEEDETEQIIKNYIEFYVDNPDQNEKDFHTRVSNLDKLCSDYSWGTDYKNTYLSKDISKNIELLPKIIANIRNEKNYSDKSQRHLNIFTENDFKKSIQNASSTYIDHIVQVSSWSISGNDLEPIKSKITKALYDLSQENEEFKRKAEDIAKHATLNLEDCK